MMAGFERRALAATIALLAVLTIAPAALAAQEQAAPAEQREPRQIEVTILGMSCPFCAYGVEQKLKKLDDVEDLKVELKSGLATIILAEGADISNETLIETVDDAGFEVAKIVRNFESEYPDYERKPKP